VSRGETSENVMAAEDEKFCEYAMSRRRLTKTKCLEAYLQCWWWLCGETSRDLIIRLTYSWLI
jgi:hypothetical protein